MVLKNRLIKLEKSIKAITDQSRVYFADEDPINGRMNIPQLDFSGTSDEGRKLMDEYPNSIFIVDDIHILNQETKG